MTWLAVISNRLGSELTIGEFQAVNKKGATKAAKVWIAGNMQDHWVLVRVGRGHISVTWDAPT